MSAKYQRIKKRDMALPAPLRWLTRAFSSITMAVVLLSLVIVYGTIASVPIFFLVLGGLYIAIAIITVGGGLFAALICWRKSSKWKTPKRATISILLAVIGVIICAIGCLLAYKWAYYSPLLKDTQSQVLRKLPYFEMTRMQFYAWWPFQTILILFVLNLIWATLRRIPFKFEYLGVLTVHSGIVVMAVGAIFYGHFRTEGDTILLRKDLGGNWVHSYYDAEMQALYVTNPAHRQLMAPLQNLPRYNDYKLGELNINLSNTAHNKKILPDNLHISIPGFLAYARLEKKWLPYKQIPETKKILQSSPAIILKSGTKTKADGKISATLLADVPARRNLNLGSMSVAYLVNPPKRRIENLTAQFQGKYGLIVKIEKKDSSQQSGWRIFKKIYSIHKGQTIVAGNSGYSLKINNIIKFSPPFTKAGYENSRDSSAIIQVKGNGQNYTYQAFYKYWKLSHKLSTATKPTAQPSGAKTKISFTFIDASKARFYIVATSANDKHPLFIARLPGVNSGKPMSGTLADNLAFPIGSQNGKSIWMHITKIIPKMAQITSPHIIPKAERKPKKQGDYSYALLPVKLTLKRPKTKGGNWSKIIWLRHMQYPRFADNEHKPVKINVPTIGIVELAFSRQRHELPFEMKMVDFKMTPYPGSQIPKNFASTLLVRNLNSDNIPTGKPKTLTASLNNPIIYYPSTAPLGMGKVKISQIGWDAPAPGDPNAFAKDAQGKYINQQRYTILGIGNNVLIHVIALGAIMIFVGIPWAFYIKPWIVRRRAAKLLKSKA